MSGTSNEDLYVKTFDAEECEIIRFALIECCKALKVYEDPWHREQAEKIRQLLDRRFEEKAE